MAQIPADLFDRCFGFFEEEIRVSTFPKKNKKKLETDMEDLRRIRLEVTTTFQEQERTRPGTECKVVVKGWLEAVDGIETEVETLVDDLNKTFSCTCCCFPCHNYRLGKEVVRLIDRVHNLVEQRGSFDADNLVRPIPPDPINNVPDQSTTMVGRDGKSSEIQGYLSDSEVTTIGIWGRGGTGKTTLMLKSIKQWLSGKDHDFRYIIWIEMFKNDDDILKIQKRIAKCIFLPLPSEHDEWDNARMLTNALQRKKSLVLIDNVWKKLDFERIGIPFAVGTTVVKIFFTTRSERVCHDMTAQKIVRLGSLNEAESLELFKRNISPVVDLTEKIEHQHVNEILRRCGGLPLVIVRVAGTVANYTRDEEWVHAVESLRMYGSQITGEEIEGGCFKLMDKFPKKNKENLEKEMDKLKGIRDVVSTTFQEQERTRPGTECQVVVKRWLDDVNGIETEVKTLVDLLGSCTCCFPCHNYFLGKGVVPLIERVDALVEERTKFDDDNLVRPILPDPIHNVPDQSTTMIGRNGKSLEIHGYLRDSEVTTIGIWGMGGIGKTTMLKSIKQWLSENDRDFHYIIWIEMSQNDDGVLKIQQEIASCIFLSLPPENEEGKNARMLTNALRGRKSLVLIDNVWKKLNFERIGIPLAEANVKILFTTRYEKVCIDMRAQKKVLLDSLDEAESLELFKTKISDVVDLTDKIVRQRVDEILKRCGGLPLVIVTVAGTVANYTRVEEWDDAVECLRSAREEIEGMDEVMKCLKFSYDKLEDDQIKSCLLYLSLYPEGKQINTEFLIKEWVAEGFLDTPNNNSFTRSYNRGVVNIEKLKSICLVENIVYSDNSVKLHDEIRHMLCWIRKHENKEVFIVYTEVSDCNYDRWDLAKRIYLLEGQLKRLPETGMPSCPNLTSLLVKPKYLAAIRRFFPTEDFFHFTPSLRVLDLSWTGLVDIPKSIGELVELRYLNLRDTRIHTLPMELANLKKLKCLDLSYTFQLVTIVGRGISQLSALQSLNLFNTKYQWKSSDVNMTTQPPLLKLEDLRALKNLEDLGVDVRSNSHLNTILCDKMLLKSIARISFARIDFTTIDLGGLQLIEWISNRLPKLKELIVHQCALATDNLEIKDDQLPLVTELSLYSLEISSVTLNDASRPFSRLKVLNIDECQQLKELSWTARLPSLEWLQVNNCNSVKELVEEEEEIREERHYFPKLHLLGIRDLKNLERIHGRSPLLFPALRHLIILNCPKLKQLSFRDDSAKNMEWIMCEKSRWDLLEWENDQIRAKFSPYVCPPLQ